jgi:hypothetical protein
LGPVSLPDMKTEDIESAMSLPMIKCLVLIKSTGAQMTEMHKKYKASAGDDLPLLETFVFSFTISNIKDFVYDNTRLAYDMMATATGFEFAPLQYM